MLSVFVFLALLEYALVNYKYFGKKTKLVQDVIVNRMDKIDLVKR